MTTDQSAPPAPTSRFDQDRELLRTICGRHGDAMPDGVSTSLLVAADELLDDLVLPQYCAVTEGETSDPVAAITGVRDRLLEAIADTDDTALLMAYARAARELTLSLNTLGAPASAPTPKTSPASPAPPSP